MTWYSKTEIVDHKTSCSTPGTSRHVIQSKLQMVCIKPQSHFHLFSIASVLLEWIPHRYSDTKHMCPIHRRLLPAPLQICLSRHKTLHQAQANAALSSNWFFFAFSSAWTRCDFFQLLEGGSAGPHVTHTNPALALQIITCPLSSCIVSRQGLASNIQSSLATRGSSSWNSTSKNRDTVIM